MKTTPHATNSFVDDVIDVVTGDPSSAPVAE
jgi:hypothetical protein